MKNVRKLALIIISFAVFATVTVAWFQGSSDPNRIPLRYEPGKDTKASFGDGSIQIQRISIERVYELVDLNKNHKTLIHRVQSYRESDSGDLVFVYGDQGTFAVIHPRTNEYEIFKTRDSIPDTYRNIYSELDQDRTIKGKI